SFCSLCRPATSILSLHDALPILPGGLSPNGRWLVVESGDSSQTHLLVIDVTTSKVRRKIDLGGYFQFDAVSDDGDRLYLIAVIRSEEHTSELQSHLNLVCRLLLE